MIQLLQSDHPEALLDALAQDIGTWRQTSGPLEPVTLIASGAVSSAYIKKGLSTRLGIFAHFEILYLNQFIQKLIHRQHPNIDLADAPRISLAILDLLHQPSLLEQEDLARVQAYLAEETALENRRLQLALTLGPLFEAYALHRPEWVKAWASKQLHQIPPGDRWQAALFCALLSPDGSLHPTLPLSEDKRHTWLLLDALKLLDTPYPNPVFVYDVPYGSEVIVEALRQVGESTPVHIYAYSPCLEFWDDLPSARSPKSGAQQSMLMEWVDDPIALRLWGRPGREYLHFASELCNWNIETRFPEAALRDHHLLDAFKQDIRHRQPATQPNPEHFASDTGRDTSLSLTVATGIRRECEAIASEIWRLAEANPNLKWSDFAVILATRDAGDYRTQLAATFADTGHLPFHEIKAALSAHSQIFDIIRLLLFLPRSSFSRNDLLRVVTHPTVQNQFDLGDTTDWVLWCERLAIFDGADHQDHQTTYIEKDLFNWDQGLRRLILGLTLPRDDQTTEPIILNNKPIYPATVPIQELLRVSRLVALTRALIADTRALSTAHYPLQDWIQYIKILIVTYISPTNAGDERDLFRIKASLDELSLQLSGTAAVSYSTAAELILDRLEHLTVQIGQPLTEAVVVGPLSSLANIPFSHVFIPGLSEGNFPASERQHALDLRKETRRKGETTPKMRDEYNFLLRLLSTNESVKLSYVVQDPETGDHRLPSATLAELNNILATGYIGADGLSPQNLSMWRHLEPGYSTSAQAEQQAANLREALRHTQPPFTLMPKVEELTASLPPPISEAWRDRFSLQYPSESATSSQETVLRLSYLQRFLEEPVQGWTQQVLKLTHRDYESTSDTPDSEPFDLKRSEAHSVLEDLFVSWFNDNAPIEELSARYDQKANQLELTGNMPTGVFGEAARARHLQYLKTWSDKMFEATEGQKKPIYRYELGRPGLQPTQVRSFPGLALHNYTLIGTTPLFLTDTATLSLTENSLDQRPPRLRLALSSWLAHVVRAIIQPSSAQLWWCYIADQSDTLHRIQFSSLDADSAQAYLTRMIKSLLQDEHKYRLPFRTQVRLYEEAKLGASTKKMAYILKSAKPDPFGPLDLSSLPTPPLDEALHLITKKLGPFLDSLEELS